jgi:hypothetical protein
MHIPMVWRGMARAMGLGRAAPAER